jgi:DNA-binding XRE family transcriptional regulator
MYNTFGKEVCSVVGERSSLVSLDPETWRVGEEGCTREWRAEAGRRVEKMSMMMAAGGESRQEVALMRQAGVVFRRLRISETLSLQDLANRLGVDRDFITFLESGLVCRDELSSLRPSLASSLNIDPETLDVLLDGRARLAREHSLPEQAR